MVKKQSLTTRSLYFYWQATKKHMGYFVLLIASTAMFVGCLTYGNPYIMGKIVDHVSLGYVPQDQLFDVYAPYLISLVLINLLGQAGSKLQDYATYKLNILVTYDLSITCFDCLCNQSVAFHSSNYGGALVSATSKFLNAYQELIRNINYPFMPILMSVICTCTLLAPLVPQYVAILLVILCLYAFTSYKMYKRILHLNEKASVAQNCLSGELSDAVTNILAVKTCGREDYEKKIFDEAAVNVRNRDSIRMKSSLIRGIITAAIALVMMTVVGIFICVGNTMFSIRPGTLIIMFTYTYSLTQQFNHLANALERQNKAFGDAYAMTSVLDEPRLVDDAHDAKDMHVNNGEIEFKNIGFSYTDGGSKTTVFNNFNLKINSGEKVGLVGVSGSGKTTLTKLLLRLSDIQVGKILVDGQNVADVTQQSLRRQIAYVPQEPLLFHRTIAENISYGRPSATVEEIEQAARNANAYDFIKSLPQGFNTLTGERGVKLSGGQRQRIAIARAMLINAPILVLDEATSALDSESEATVQDALAKLMKGRTTIVVAHRLSTVANLDRIVVLKQGEIIEDGSHSDLIRLNGEYARLWNRQTQVNEELKRTA